MINLMKNIFENRSMHREYDYLLKFLEDKFWTITEAVDFILMMNSHDIPIESFAEERQRYLDKFSEALGNSEIQFANKKFKSETIRDQYFIKVFYGDLHPSGPIDDTAINAIKIACRIDDKNKQKCVNRLDVIEFIACKNMIGDCELKKTGLRLHSLPGRKTNIIVERPANAPLTHAERGTRKYHKIHKFSDEVIKVLGLQELEAGCLCLHRDVVNRITPKVMMEVDIKLKFKDHRNFMKRSEYHIEKTIKELFYGLGDKFDNVKSRVFRGDHYNEYCNRQPPPALCGIHQHRK